ncbi:MAG: PEP-utilizing enzyme [Oscillospiraceae bacterium]|nr:PEP-utilizing enzyme [Oscillospiraceae bacterium]
MIKAVTASPGIGIGRAVIAKARQWVLTPQKVDPGLELRRMEEAVEVFCEQVSAACKLARQSFGESESAIIAAQIAIVRDLDFMEAIEEQIKRQSHSAGGALAHVLDGYTTLFSEMSDRLMRAREADFRDIKHRLLGILAGEKPADYSHITEGSVIVADDLHASVLVCMPVEKIAAILTEGGSPHSHLAILTQAARIPHLIGVKNVCKLVKDGEGLIADGRAGEVIIRPTIEEVGRYQDRQRLQSVERKRQETHRERDTQTRDGRPVKLLAALTALGDVSQALEYGMDGGCVPYLEQAAGTTTSKVEQQQFLVYKALTRALEGRSAIITVEGLAARPEISPDWAERKSPSPKEQQLRAAFSALLRASAFGKVEIALTGGQGLCQVRKLFDDCKAVLLERKLGFDTQMRLGAVIETPISALNASSLVKEADFLVIETDVLAGYTLAIDRIAKKPEERGLVFHPAFLRLIHETIQAAQSAGRPVVVAGEIACDPMMIPFLVGCGASALSVHPALLPSARNQCVNLRYVYWQERLPEILALSTAEEVVQYLKQNWAERL